MFNIRNIKQGGGTVNSNRSKYQVGRYYPILQGYAGNIEPAPTEYFFQSNPVSPTDPQGHTAIDLNDNPYTSDPTKAFQEAFLN